MMTLCQELLFTRGCIDLIVRTAKHQMSCLQCFDETSLKEGVLSFSHEC